MPRMGRRLLVALVLLLCLPLPAQAHEGDNRVRTVLDEVVPALPPEVVVQVRSSTADQVVVANPTATVLQVLDSGGRPFLELSRAGVRGNLSSLDFYTTANPGATSQGVPKDVLAAGGRGAPRWVLLSNGDSWGWFDHRLHPAGVAIPQAERRTRLFDWTIPLLYGARPATVSGHVELSPLLGTFEVVALTPPDGVRLQVLQGRQPGLVLSAAEGRAVTVAGRDGEPFLKLGPGAQVNTGSRTYVEDQQLRGRAAGTPSPTPRFVAVPGGASYSWLDARLRYPASEPPEEVLRRSGTSVVQRWALPATVDGAPVMLTGEIRWIPNPGLAKPRDKGSATWWPYAVGAVVVVLGGTVLLRRHR